MPINYRYEFRYDEGDAMFKCLRGHGFAVIKDLLTPEENARLSASVRRTAMPTGKMPEGQTNVYNTTFVEYSPELVEMLRNPRFMTVAKATLPGAELVVHRSACIVRQPGDGGMLWHSDYQYTIRPPSGGSEALNVTPPDRSTPSMWFYLTGCNPTDGGIAIIPDSHRLDWQPPEGYELSHDRRFLRRKGDPKPLLDINVPGAMPVHIGPNDLILFDLATYHGVFPHKGTQTRLSCALVMRDRSLPFTVPWGRTPEAVKLAESVPADLKSYFEDYVGLDHKWRPEPVAAKA